MRDKEKWTKEVEEVKVQNAKLVDKLQIMENERELIKREMQ